MSDDIKKLLSIMNETTTSGAVAPIAGGIGKSMLKRPADSIFAAESVPEGADTGLEAAPKVDSPSNFGLWKNSAVIATEQYGKHGRKKAKVDKTTIYPQLAEAVEPEQSVIDNTRRSRLDSERNAGLNEPDEKPDFGGSKSGDFGTWHFKFDSGNIVKKDGKPLLASSIADAKGIVDRASQNGVTIRIVSGAPDDLSETYNAPKDMDEWTEEEWSEWDAKVGRVGAKAKAQEKEQEDVAEGSKQLNELSKDTVQSYKKKAETDYAKQRKRMSRAYYKDVDKYDDASIKSDARKSGIKAAKTRLDKEDVAEGLPQTLRKIVPGYAKREIDKKMDAQKFGKDDVAKDANYYRYKKIQDKLKEQGVAEGKEDKIAQLKADYETSVHWSKNEKSPQKREAARQKAEKIKRHLDAQYKTKLDEYSEWDGTGDQDLAAATAANGQEAGFADIEDKTSLSEAEITEEMIADRLKSELALFKSGTKSPDKSIGKKPVDKEVQVKEVSDKKLDNYMAGVSADSQKHPADPTKRDPKKANKSVAGFSKAFNRRQKSDDQKKSEDKK